MRSLRYENSELEKIFEEYKRGQTKEYVDSSLNDSFCNIFPDMLKNEVDNHGAIWLSNNDDPELLDDESRQNGSGGYACCDFTDFVVNLDGNAYNGRLWLNRKIEYSPKDLEQKGELREDGTIEHPVDLQDVLAHQFDVSQPQESIQFDVELLERDGLYKKVELDNRSLELLEKNYYMNNISTVENQMEVSKEAEKTPNLSLLDIKKATKNQFLNR